MVPIQCVLLWRRNGMCSDKVTLRNIKNISSLSVEFTYPESNILVITGKNGTGKTSLVKAFHLITDPSIFEKTAGLNAIRQDSEISFDIDGFKPFVFQFNKKLKVIDTKDALPTIGEVVAELPIPYGMRFKRFALISSYDGEIRSNIASTQYILADELIEFLSSIYSTDKFKELNSVKAGKYHFYFLLGEQDYYIREDHLSSGEFFLIQFFRLITSGAKLVVIDEFDVALDAATQVKLYAVIKPLLKRYNTRLIVISHSLAFIQTVDDGGLYFLEENSGEITLEQRSFGYVKSALYGFEGYDRYILTEDPVLEGFIEYIINKFSITPYYQYKIIGVAGWNQLKLIIEKNDTDKIFTDSSNVRGIVDGDAYPQLSQSYRGPTRILSLFVEDIEKFIFLNREGLLPEIELPPYQESEIIKKASKCYWKYLTNDKGMMRNDLYQLVIDSQNEKAEILVREIKDFLEKGLVET